MLAGTGAADTAGALIRSPRVAREATKIRGKNTTIPTSVTLVPKRYRLGTVLTRGIAGLSGPRWT